MVHTHRERLKRCCDRERRQTTYHIPRSLHWLWERACVALLQEMNHVITALIRGAQPTHNLLPCPVKDPVILAAPPLKQVLEQLPQVVVVWSLKEV